jgi:hypothetical protein
LVAKALKKAAIWYGGLVWVNGGRERLVLGSPIAVYVLSQGERKKERREKRKEDQAGWAKRNGLHRTGLKQKLGLCEKEK